MISRVMYTFILFIHSWLRWILLGFLVLTFARSLIGWIRKDKYTELDDKLRLSTVSLYDLQVLLGVYMYTFLSPTVRSAIKSMSEAMKDSQLRFFLLEHAFGMITALVVLHVGNIFVKKKTIGTQQHKYMFITLLIVILITLASIPWPGLPYGRVWFRGF